VPATEPAAPGDHRRWGVADDGAVVSVEVPADLAHLLDPRWPPLGLARLDAGRDAGRDADPPRPPARHLAITVGPATGDATLTVDGEASHGGWDRLESELAIFAAERLAGLVAVHAAVVVHRRRTLVLPGASGVGKSTLCVAAAALGASVLTDEYALVEPATGRVTGWPRPVRLRRRDGTVDRIDLTVPSPPAAVHLVALLTHDAAAGSAWQPVAAADAVLGLLANTVCARSRPDESLDAALAIGRSARVVAGTRGEATAAIRDLLAELDR
jgi:hypothetical protein